ncbi:hypothetical protein F5146DRAFT_1006386 [Armillaria mellea]|nr:hypothetical protein F5146DRAFT_1006386 [Armillaria mellea]
MAQNLSSLKIMLRVTLLGDSPFEMSDEWNTFRDTISDTSRFPQLPHLSISDDIALYRIYTPFYRKTVTVPWKIGGQLPVFYIPHLMMPSRFNIFALPIIGGYPPLRMKCRFTNMNFGRWSLYLTEGHLLAIWRDTFNVITTRYPTLVYPFSLTTMSSLCAELILKIINDLIDDRDLATLQACCAVGQFWVAPTLTELEQLP